MTRSQSIYSRQSWSYGTNKILIHTHTSGSQEEKMIQMPFI